MKNKYDIIQQLISLWQEFEWKNPGESRLKVDIFFQTL